VVHVYNLSTVEIETVESQVQEGYGLHSDTLS
jgi:hypothetical protein